MRSHFTTQKSKFFRIWTFVLLFLTANTLGKPAWAFRSTVDQCLAQPACAGAIAEELVPAIAAPTAAGVTNTAVTVTAGTDGLRTAVNVAAGVAVVATVLSPQPTGKDDLNWYYWGQSQNQSAQEKAKQRYCEGYPDDIVCGVRVVTFYSPNNGIWIHNQIPRDIISYTITDCYTTDHLFSGKSYIFTRPDGTFPPPPCGGPEVDLSTLTDITTGEVPWKDWPQQKRSIAIAALKEPDWQEFIKSMPEGGRLIPGDQLDAPVIVFPGLDTDDPTTPEDDRLPKVIPGPWTIPYPDLVPTPSPSPSPSPSPTPNPSPSPSPSLSPSPSPSPSPTPPPPTNNTDPPPDAPPPPDSPSPNPDGEILRQPGEGIDVNAKWGNPLSEPAYGHSVKEHGSKRPSQQLKDRARTKNIDQGQWYDNQFIVEAEQRAPLIPGENKINMKKPVGRVYRPDGTVVENVQTVKVIRKPNLAVKTSYPTLDTP